MAPYKKAKKVKLGDYLYNYNVSQSRFLGHLVVSIETDNTYTGAWDLLIINGMRFCESESHTKSEEDCFFTSFEECRLFHAKKAIALMLALAQQSEPYLLPTIQTEASGTDHKS